MNTFQFILLIILIVSSIAGYFLISNVPSLLHTPLMSGMNALSGITILGALIATGKGQDASLAVKYIFGSLAIILAMINVAGGFSVTNRMLKMFSKKSGK